ncbi:MAG: 2-oxoacid:acceptor oxidoreductase family protein [Candidatus Rokubacteria bacterium]|nr:2-oxoacid:acceptor oxidoreductase family protein [Candidatus Rokubacteria bacterium]
MTWRKKEPATAGPAYPGGPTVVDGAEAVARIETMASDALALAPSPFTSTIAAAWARAVGAGATNSHGRRLVMFEPESDEAAAAIVTGLAMTGARASVGASGDGAAAMHASLAAAAGKRLPCVLHLVCRPFSRQAVPTGAGHDDYHALADTGAFQLFAKNVQEVADFAVIAHRLAELALTPGVAAQDAGLTSATLESISLPGRDLVREYLGSPADVIDAPTPAQGLVFGERRRRVPERFDPDLPVALGGVQRADAWAQGAAAQRPYYLDHIARLTDRAFQEYAALTGRQYAPCSAYRIDDAEHVIVAQGAVVADAEAIADHLRAAKKWKVGVVGVTMLRPFPVDLVVDRLRGRRGVLVLERVDQPLALEAPLVREIRAAMAKAVENGRARAGVPRADVARCGADEVPDFYSACFGLGGRDLGPADLLAAVNAIREGGPRRQFYLGIDFVRKGTRLPKLQIWQEQLLERYPAVADLALVPAANGVVRADDTVVFRLDATGGSTLLGTAATLSAALAQSLGLQVKAGPGWSAERDAEPVAFHARFSRTPVRASGGPPRVDVLLAADAIALGHLDPACVWDGGAVVVATDASPEDVWQGLAPAVRRALVQSKVRVYTVGGLSPHARMAPDARAMTIAATLVGAFLGVSGLVERERLDEKTVFERLARRLAERAVPDAGLEVVAAIRHGFTSAREIDLAALPPAGGEIASVPRIPHLLETSRAPGGPASAGRFWEQVGFLYASGQDGIADPFVAVGAMPAVTAAIRDMTELRREVPEIEAARCTGCAACWTQCPDSAIPGVVNGLEDVLRTAIAAAGAGRAVDRLRQLVRPLADEARRLMRATASMTFAEALPVAYANIVDKLGWDADRRAAVASEFEPVAAALAEAAIVRTEAFFDAPESRERGTGGLLALAINPETCKGCGLCVEVCLDQALTMVPQDSRVVDRMRRRWRLWRDLPDTDDRRLDPGAVEPAIELLPRLMLKKASYGSLLGGDGACAGCGEKTALHLVLAAVHALVLPKVRALVTRLDELIASLDDKARTILASDADLGTVAARAGGRVDVTLDPGKRRHVERLSSMLDELKDIRWRYAEGPTGRGRSACGIANSGGCSALWGGTYPYNPYPVPWVQHAGHDSPALALGLFEGQMQKMACVFAAVRRAELEVAGEYDPAVHDAELAALDWRGFTDDEMALCPPILAVGGDAALLDRGLHTLSTVLASGRPVRVVVLDTEGHASASGRPSGSAFCGQRGTEARAPEETRKELALLGVAQRNAFVLQSSAAAPSHLLAGVLKGLRSRRPALLVLHTPCPSSHGLPAAATPRAARLAVESRACPLLVYDPGAGSRLAERLSLDGNPAPDQPWPTWELGYVGDDGSEQRLELALTVADWAAAEGRFRTQFTPPPPDGDVELVPFPTWLALAPGDRAGKAPFVHVVDAERRLGRLVVGDAIVRLAEERLEVWSLLREMAGAGERRLAAEHEGALAKLKAEHEATVADLRSRYPRLIARRLAEAILKGGDSVPKVDELLARADRAPAAPTDGVAPALAPAAATAVLEAPAAVAAPAAVEESKPLVMEAYIDSEMCTACNDCTNLNKRLFAYNKKKQAYIKDARAGTFKELVIAAEKCPVHIIHPGSPLDPGEKDLHRWVERARPFN